MTEGGSVGSCGVREHLNELVEVVVVIESGEPADTTNEPDAVEPGEEGRDPVHSWPRPGR